MSVGEDGRARRFICSVGIGDYREQSYQYQDGDPIPTRLAPVAVARAVHLRGAATVVVTAKAKERWYATLAEELREAGLEPSPLEIPDGVSENELMQMVEGLFEAVQPDELLTVDVTLALRHLPFVYLAALVYLTSVRRAEIEGIYYAASDLAGGGPTQIVNLGALYKLIQGFHALSTSHDHGDLRPLAGLLRREVAGLRAASPEVSRERLERLGKARDGIERLAESIAAGLPLEAGRDAANARDALRRLSEAEPAHSGATVLATSAALSLTDFADPWTLSTPYKDKTEVVLSSDEIRRQYRFAKWHADRGNTQIAVLVMRELVVNALILGTGGAARWLDVQGTRQPAEDQLHRLSLAAKNHELTEETLRALVNVWQSVTDLRNNLAHVGMRKQPASGDGGKVSELLEACRKLVDRPSPGVITLPTCTGSILVSGLGLTPGALYSALRHIDCARLVVVTSRQGVERLHELLQQSGKPDQAHSVVTMEDPFTGFSEVRAKVREAAAVLRGADEVVINLTGGTTAIQYCVEAIAREAGALRIPTRRVAMVDRRSPEDQRRNPWVLGELVPVEDHA